jgi:hypothetical protein
MREKDDPTGEHGPKGEHKGPGLHRRPASAVPVDGMRRAAVGEPPRRGGGVPLGGPALLDRLRATGRSRPTADPSFADELRSFIEVGIAEVPDRRSPTDGDRWFVTPDRLERVLSCRAHRRPGEGAERSFTLPLACGALVGVLFRQVVTVGHIEDPVTEALEGLSLDERQVPLVAWIEGLARSERAELDMEVARQARGLVDRWPPFDPSWLPRTDEVLRVPLRDSPVELTTRVDLAIGRPAVDIATVALVELATGGLRPGHRHARAFDALVETLRSSVPPFAVITYYSRTGEVDVDPVDHELLAAAARRCVTGTRRLLGTESPTDDTGWCGGCASQLRRPPVVLTGGAPEPPVDRVAGLVDLTREVAA